MTLVLTANEVELLVTDFDAAFAALDAGFRSQATAQIPGQRIRSALPGRGNVMVLLPGLLAGVPAYTVKVNAKFPAATPALRGIVCLHSLTDGALLALLDSASVTAWRTGLAAALATDLLARRDAATVGIVGAGAQARVFLHGLTARRPVTYVRVHDRDAERAQAFCDLEVGGRGYDGEAATLDEVTRGSEIILTATWSKTPLISRDDAWPGQHFTSLGADEPGKRELSADLLEEATVVVDDRDLARQVGVAATADVGAEVDTLAFSDILAGAHAGRSSDREITVYAPVGLPWQDLALSWWLYEIATRRRLGVTIDFLHRANDPAVGPPQGLELGH